MTGQPYVVEIWVNAAGTNADPANARTVTYDPTQLQVTQIETPQLEDIAVQESVPVAAQSGSAGHRAIFPGLNFSIPGLLLIIMTITSFVSQRMTTMPTEDPQQQAMMRSMAFMPLMYLFFFLNTPAGLVLYWLTSNVFSAFQQYFTVGLGLLGGDLLRITGRDLQPPWAVACPGSTAAPVAALAAADVEQWAGRHEQQSQRWQNTWLWPGCDRRNASAAAWHQGKGRKRGKR